MAAVPDARLQGGSTVDALAATKPRTGHMSAEPPRRERKGRLPKASGGAQATKTLIARNFGPGPGRILPSWCSRIVPGTGVPTTPVQRR
jgi:hypothetical protein